jgi:hypothetical protein
MKKHDLHTIDQYLAGALSIKEATAFENRLREDEKFRKQFEQIRFIIAGIQRAAIFEEMEELGHIRALNGFLETGGVLLRASINDLGQNVIERLSIDREWNTIIICEKHENCIRLINRMLKNHPDRFRTLGSKVGHTKSRIGVN